MLTLFLGAVLILYFFIVQRVSVEVGEEATLIKKPWFYGKKGINLSPITEGTIWSVKSTDIEKITIQPFPINEHFKQLLTSDNIPLDIDIHFTFQHIKGKTPELIQTFGKDLSWYTNNLKEPLSNSVRMFIKKTSFEAMTQEENTSIDLQETMVFGIKDFLTAQNIPTQLLDVRVGAINIPKSILKIALKNEEKKQMLQTEILRKNIEEASAEADRAYMKKMNINVKEYIKLKQLELKTKELNNQYFAIESANEGNSSLQINMSMSSQK